MYCLCVPIGLLSVCWAVIPEITLQSLDISYYPPKSLAITVPTFTIIGFIMIPLVYSLLNFLSAPSYTSKDTIWDLHSIKMSNIKSCTGGAEKSRQVEVSFRNCSLC